MTDEKLALASLALLMPLAAGATQTPLASPEQIHACLNRQDELREQRADVMRRIDAHEQRQGEVRSAIAALDQARQRLDASDAQALRDHNAQVKQLNTEVQALNQRGAQLRQEQAGYNQFATATNQRCGTLRYKMQDYYRVMNERAAQGKAE
jgi:cell pole-organizing protein PopZ